MAYLWIFTIFDAAALVLVASELWIARAPLPKLRQPHLPPALAVLAIVAAYVLQLAAVTYAVHHQNIAPGPAGMLPVPLLSGIAVHGDAVCAVVLACGALQMYALWNVYRSACSTKTVALGTAALAALSLLSPVMISPDAYAYVGDALLGLHAYAPPAAAFGGAFAPIDRWWGTPVPATPYGPLWIATAWLVTAPFSALLAKILALRLLGAACLAGLLAVMRSLRSPARLLALVALNPGLSFQFVASAHNDALGILLVVAGGLYVQARPLAAIALMTAGALIKLPFALFAAPLLAAQRSPAARAGMLVAVLAIAGALSYLAGGSGFIHAQTPHLASSGVAEVTTLAVAVSALLALAVAFLRGRRLRSVVWLLPLVSAYTCAWYLLWSLPYALARRRIAAYLLTAYPFASILLEVKFMQPWTLFAVVPAVVALQVLAWREP